MQRVSSDNNNGFSRRDALKRMGLLMAGVASLGMGSLTSCREEAKKRIILYFTGTGNSLYIARQLADENTEILSIPQMMKQGRHDFAADEIGIVYPIYGHMPPNMVRNFIKQARLLAGYKFAVLTFGMLDFNAAEIWDNISRQSGTTFDYINTIVMVDNWLPDFNMADQIKMDKHIPEQLAKVKDDLGQQKKWVKPATDAARRAHEGFMYFSRLDPDIGFLMRSEKYFQVTDACIGCGICTEVCPRGNYKLTSEGVKGEGDCDFCFSCIHNCPQHAI